MPAPGTPGPFWLRRSRAFCNPTWKRPPRTPRETSWRLALRHGWMQTAGNGAAPAMAWGAVPCTARSHPDVVLSLGLDMHVDHAPDISLLPACAAGCLKS